MPTPPTAGPCRVAVPARPAGLIWQDFETGAETQPRQDLPEDMPPGPPIAPPVMPLAEAIARIALARRVLPGLPRPAPVYLRPADAAPPSEPPPVILP